MFESDQQIPESTRDALRSLAQEQARRRAERERQRRQRREGGTPKGTRPNPPKQKPAWHARRVWQWAQALAASGTLDALERPGVLFHQRVGGTAGYRVSWRWYLDSDGVITREGLDGRRRFASTAELRKAPIDDLKEIEHGIATGAIWRWIEEHARERR